MSEYFLLNTLSIFFLLTICLFVYIVSKRIKFPYTVLLVFVGILLIPISSIPYFSFISYFQLTPELLFYVFLPILIFESAYNISYRSLLKSFYSISGLSVVGFLISAFFIAIAMYYILPFIGFPVPFFVCLLFGSIISATDPVAVLAIFKTVGAPRRLTLIFEGESLFNDGTAVALFMVVFELIKKGGEVYGKDIFLGALSFIVMIVGGIIFGACMGIGLSKLIQYIKNNELVEITLTMVVAHLTFIFAEIISENIALFGFRLDISEIIATAVAGIIIGNYGRYKISPKVEKHMSQFWEFFAFIANSLVFISMGLILSQINVHFTQFFWVSILVILIVMIARAVSVYVPLYFVNTLKLEEPIPLSWQHLLAWGSLRGALALMMVILLPSPGMEGYEYFLEFQNNNNWNYDFTIKDFLMVLVIVSIMFTLFIKATTITFFVKKLGINKLHALEQFEYFEGKIISNLKILQEIDRLYQRNYIHASEMFFLKSKYEKDLRNSIKNMTELIQSKGEAGEALIRKAITLHALGIEKQYLKELFLYNEIDEKNFKFLLNKINNQIERIEEGKPQFKEICEEEFAPDIFQKIYFFFFPRKKSIVDEYVINRAKIIVTYKVIKDLHHLAKIDFGFDKKIFADIIEIYESFYKKAYDKRDALLKEYDNKIFILEEKLTEKTLLKIEENIIFDLYQKEIITPKLYIQFSEEIEKGILKEIHTIF